MYKDIEKAEKDRIVAHSSSKKYSYVNQLLSIVSDKKKYSSLNHFGQALNPINSNKLGICNEVKKTNKNVAQREVIVNSVHYLVMDDVIRLLADSTIGWDENWTGVLRNMLNRGKTEFSNIHELEEFLEQKIYSNDIRSRWQDEIQRATGKKPPVKDNPKGAYHAAPGRWAETIAENGIIGRSSGEQGLITPYACFAPTPQGMAILGEAKPVAFRIKSADLGKFSFINWGAGGSPAGTEIRCVGNVPARYLECTPFLGHKNGIWVDALTQLNNERNIAYKGRRYLIMSDDLKKSYDEKKAREQAKKSNK